MACVRLIDVDDVLSSLEQLMKARRTGLSGFTRPISGPRINNSAWIE